jgi:hypothetical protein
MRPENTDFPEYLFDGMRQLAEALEGRRINYALIGGVAAAYRSRPRYTEDLDLLLQIPQLALPGLLDDLRARGFAFEPQGAINEWARDNLTVLSYHGVRVDWLKPVLPLYQHVIDQARPEDWFGRPVRIATAEGLILLKLIAFRTQDQLDIENLLAANQGQLDIEQVRREWQSVAAPDDPRMMWFDDRITRFYLPALPEG